VAIHPDWHPTEDRILFRAQSGAFQVTDSKGAAPQDLVTGDLMFDDGTSMPIFGEWPTWSPDGMAIAYVGLDTPTAEFEFRRLVVFRLLPTVGLAHNVDGTNYLDGIDW
jgi:hypothetical protein